MSITKYNKSKTYLLPLLSEVLDLDLKFMPYLINTYMFDEDQSEKECLYILHKFSFKNPEFTAYEHKLTNNELFIKCIDIDDMVLYVFKFPKEYLPEYYSLYNSEYSKFGNDAKELIIKFWATVLSGNPNGIPFLMKIKKILYKDKKLKEEIEKNLKVKLDQNQELGDYVDVNNETFKLINIKQGA